MKKSIIAGITEDGELYRLTIETQSETHDYFAMTGDTSAPIKTEDAKDRVREQLEDGEEWKQAVEAGNTTMGKDEWVDYVLDNDGELAGFDNSLFPIEIEIDGEEWIFESRSCGQHEEDELAHYFIPEEQYRAIMTLWKQYHLKPEPNAASMARGVLDRALAIEQDEIALATKAIEIINAGA